MQVRGAVSLVSRLLALLGSVAVASFADAAGGSPKPSFEFNSITYFARWAQGSQHEFTPAGQADLEKWSDMVTANVYAEAHDGESLAKMANATLDNYKSHQAVIVKTDSVPRSADKPAEHLVVAVFGRQKYVEIAFNRFVMVDGTGCSFAYSHRVYGAQAGGAASTWLSANGPGIERALLNWHPPTPAALVGKVD